MRLRMNYRVLTVSREFGSGSGRVEQSIAKRLGRKLLGSAMIDGIACSAHLDAGVGAVVMSTWRDGCGCTIGSPRAERRWPPLHVAAKETF